ncbi:MAG: PEP-CTERM sorting domain-containing protein [Armatimonadetes bacterium]|nr:PEP-CTERM sorting domain-containing protein [Armatimonadota bacterium]MBS1711390.1 PEP-CTERM sorting domain-containing protein [Armatimonadota bacterium]MBX3107685.1 PEP-CTERM sorting domain-containing protein [Fimbriimonadaceae bacterium]
MKIKITAVAVASLAVSSAFAQTTIYSNSPTGDAFTNAGSSGAFQTVASPTGFANASWYYSEVKNGGIVGIDGANPRTGSENGSAHFNVAANALGGRADMELRDTTAGYLGLFDNVTAWSVDTYTLSGDIPNSALNLRMELYNPNNNMYGNLVFDPTDTPSFNTPVTGLQWNTFDFFSAGNTYKLNATSSLGAAYGALLSGGTPMTFASWQSALAGQGFLVLSVDMGWGTATSAFEGYADNYALGFGGQTQTYNFEVVPEPATMAVLALPALAALRRRKK